MAVFQEYHGLSRVCTECGAMVALPYEARHTEEHNSLILALEMLSTSLLGLEMRLTRLSNTVTGQAQ